MTDSPSAPGHRTPEFPEYMDPEKPGSRFTTRAALAVVTRRGGASRFDEPEVPGDPEAVVAEVLGADASEMAAALGGGSATNGSYGRGAEGWVPVIEWVMQAAVGGLVEVAAWEGIKAGARRLRALIERLRREEVRVALSRGAAALIAIAYVLDNTGEQGILDAEAVTEPSALAGRSVTELSYVEIEQWLVFLVNETRTVRYIVAVSPAGDVVSWMHIPMEKAEGIFGALPPRA